MMRKRRMMDSQRGPAKYPRMGVSVISGMLPSGACCSIGFACYDIYGNLAFLRTRPFVLSFVKLIHLFSIVCPCSLLNNLKYICICKSLFVIIAHINNSYFLDKVQFPWVVTKILDSWNLKNILKSESDLFEKDMIHALCCTCLTIS